jgi:hypothetical protein
LSLFELRLSKLAPKIINPIIALFSSHVYMTLTAETHAGAAFRLFPVPPVGPVLLNKSALPGSAVGDDLGFQDGISCPIGIGSSGAILEGRFFAMKR